MSCGGRNAQLGINMENLMNYAVAKIRAKEARLIKEPSFVRLSQSRNVNEFVKLLAECGYKPDENIDLLLSQELATVYEYVKDAVKDENILYPFLLKYDLFNMGVYLKAQLLGEKIKIEKLPFMNFGNYSVELLTKSLREKATGYLPRELFDAFFEAKEIYTNTNDISLAQIHLDKVGYEYAIKGLTSLNNKFITKYYKTDLDIRNLMFVFRLKRMDSQDFIKKLLINGGYVVSFDIIKAFNLSLADLKELFSRSLSKKTLEDAFSYFELNKSFSEIEAKLRENTKDIVNQTQLIPFGIEPIIAYVINSEDQINRIRQLYYTTLATKNR